MDGGAFTMNGGTISGNWASNCGGGVYMNGSTFTKSGGTIYGSGESRDDAEGNPLENASGDAVYACIIDTSSGKEGNHTAGTDDKLSYNDEGQEDIGWDE